MDWARRLRHGGDMAIPAWALAAFGLTAVLYALAVRGIQLWSRCAQAGTSANGPGRGV